MYEVGPKGTWVPIGRPPLALSRQDRTVFGSRILSIFGLGLGVATAATPLDSKLSEGFLGGHNYYTEV